MNPDTINLTTTHCLTAVEYWGHTTYHNLCTGQITDIPWSPLTPFYIVGFSAAMLAVAVGVYRILTKGAVL